MGAHGFKRTITNRVVANLEDVERGLLLDLFAQVVDLIEPEDSVGRDPLADLVGIDPDAVKPEDPALARLFPDAFMDDDEAAAQFRRFTERDLRRQKSQSARTAIETLERSGAKIVLTEDEAQAWLGALNDLRLVLGTRLGVSEDMDWAASLAEDEGAAVPLQLYDWLTYLQEGLVQALMR